MWWDLTSPIFILGALAVITGIVAGGLKALGRELRILASSRRQFIVLLAGIALMTIPQVVAHSGHMRIVELEVFPVESDDCTWIEYVVKVRSAGGSGVFTGNVSYPDGRSNEARAFGLSGPGDHTFRSVFSPIHGARDYTFQIEEPNKISSTFSIAMDC
ncbi:hypothetical protein IU469_19980 [Nocardia puris]|uniref:hypothetical protein n=1 Tax=Nocardia puris TaxID=208602 RepID=UPI0018934152|nr:hypothetical protein [Nocardia puris]MBF6212992.1 hypothetical protein [Nocardia puris]MBF6367983.1 hypothetical protein [Nocardia puris]